MIIPLTARQAVFLYPNSINQEFALCRLFFYTQKIIRCARSKRRRTAEPGLAGEQGQR
nr:MAG TPA: hypothetical protein [Caudoviricetes sp.]